MDTTYLEEIYHSMYKRFPSAIDHLDFHPSINNTKHPSTQNLASTNQAETQHVKCNIDSQP